MKKIIYIIILTILITGCDSKIKDSTKKIKVEKGTEIDAEQKLKEELEIIEEKKKSSFLGAWVGYFEKDNEKYSKRRNSFGKGGWRRENKINISIDKIRDTLVVGHSVVAGNDRPFKGVLKNDQFEVKEPGDDKYDGVFKFRIIDNKLTGEWEAYKNINIKYRVYSLEKMNFEYNADVMIKNLQKYRDWLSFYQEKNNDKNADKFEEWVMTEFITSSDKIFSLNASNTLLHKNDVENLRKGDLSIIRNTIYARHGYSFKNRSLRVFFDAQSWYMPIHSDIKSDFTDIEKKNIKLLLRYQKNALEYYDYYGR